MWKYMGKQSLRAPLWAVAMILAAAVLVLVLCELHQAGVREKENYEQICRTAPVTLTVTNLTGTDPTALNAPKWVLNVFSEDTTVIYGLADYIRELHVKMLLTAESSQLGVVTLAGITDLAAEQSLVLQSDSAITWLDGYGPDCLSGNEDVCVVSESQLPADGSMELDITVSYMPGLQTEILTHTRTLQIVGIHKSDRMIYCPFDTLGSICSRVDRPYELYSIYAVLADNSQLEQVRQRAAKWFAEPSFSGEKTPWDFSWYSYYPYALKIDDSQLRAAEETMRNSRTINEICTVLVFALSAVSGFLIGVLVIRRRKQEIVLMRTMGAPNRSVFIGFVLEQMLYVLFGIILGGAYNGWQPIERLGLFAGIYFVGLSAALLIMLRKNLLVTLKEDE